MLYSGSDPGTITVSVSKSSEVSQLKKRRRPPRKREPRTRINERIRVPEIRVIDSDGSQIGVMSPKDALQIARSKELDLVEIAPQATPPVCKIVDFGKYRYEQQKREKLQKKNQVQQQLKEVRLHPRTDTHDLDFKTRHAREWLEEGHKVKFSVLFKGREMAHKDIGADLLDDIIDKLEDVAKIDQDIRMDGRNMHMTLAPEKKKKKG